MELRICHLYPEVLNLYGDRGNIECMQRRLQWRGIDCTVDRIGIGDQADLTRYDLFFIGGGQDFEQEVLLADLKQGKDREIRAAIEDGRTFLVICGGYQMLGNYYETHDGVKNEFLGAIDFYTKGGDVRMIGNYAFRVADPLKNSHAAGGVTDNISQNISQPGETSTGNHADMAQSRGQNLGHKQEPKEHLPQYDDDIIVVGFENHSGKTYLGKGVKPLGTIIKGGGNNGEDGTEGVHYKNVFGSYSHGPILPKNPRFADYLLQTTLQRKYGSAELEPLSPLPDHFENEAHDSVLAKVLAGTTGHQD